MTISFLKLRVGANDFLLIDGSKQATPAPGSLPLFARRILDRRSGAGANGLLLLRIEGREFGMRTFDADGAPSMAVDDALLCAARYLFDSALVGRDGFVILSDGVPASIDVIDSRHFRLSLGSPYSSLTHEAFARVPVPGCSFIAEVMGNTVSVLPVHLRSDSAVLFWRDTLPSVTKIRGAVKSLPGLTGIDAVPVIVRLLGSEELEAKVARIERASRASIAGAALAASAVNGFCGIYAQVSCDDAKFAAEWFESGNEIRISGSAEYSFEGTYFWDEEE